VRLVDLAGKPVETFEETVTGGLASALDIPLPLPQVGQTKLLGDLLSAHLVGEILFVLEDQQILVPHLIFLEHPVHLVPLFADPVPIVGVDNEDETLGVLVVVPPEGPDLVLTPDVPHGEVRVLVFDGFDVEPDGGDGGHDLTEFQLIQDGGLTLGIKTNHKNTAVLLHVADQPVEQTRES